ncbi:MAG TPA: hypothetical protein VHB79_12530 [Polyangiaceae bacterium]|nr:hypothetical protein [Polyangiaceae bacterium]
MKSSIRFCLLGASAVILAQACGSADDKKKAQPTTHYQGGGEGGEGNSSTGGSKPTAGSGGRAGASTTGGSGGTENVSGGEAGQSSTTEGGTAPTTGSGGEGGMSLSGTAGAAGADAGPTCPTGFGECDDDPGTVCEQSLSLVTSCGDCDTSCTSTNGTVACEDLKCVLKGCNSGFGDCNNDAKDACETTLTDNSKNCGVCGRDCSALGSTCKGSVCQDIALQTGQPVGSDSGGNVNWTFSTYGLIHTPFYGYFVQRYPLDGGATQSIYTTTNKQTGTQAVLAIGDEVYWAELGTGGDDFTSAVYKKNITDAVDVLPTLAFGPEWKPQFLRKQGNALYWFSGDYQSGDPSAFIYTRALSATLADHGTKIMSVDQGTHNGILGFNVTSDALYWVSTKALTGTANELRTAPIAGGAPSAVPAVNEAFPTTVVASGYVPVDLEVSGNTVYFNRHAGDAVDGIYSYKAGDAAPTLVAKADAVTSFVLDDTYVYYLRQNTAGIWKAKLSGSAGTQISTSNFSKLIAQDAQFVYAIQSGCCSGNIFKVIK